MVRDRQQSKFKSTSSFNVDSILSSRRSVLKPVKMTPEKRPENRCIKYSPIVQPSSYQPTLEAHECDGRLWQSTFQAMGGLRASGMEDVKTFTILNKQPYHCAVTARSFQAAYGPLARFGNVSRPSVRGYKSTKKESSFMTIGKAQLPFKGVSNDPNYIHPSLFTGMKPKDQQYLPPSSIRIRWGESVSDNRDVLCEWLAKKFGQIMFVIPEGLRSCIVVFRDIKSCYEAVNAGIKPSLLSITWCDPKFYNFGHYNIYKEYSLVNDPHWNRGVDNLREMAPTVMFSGLLI